MNSESKQQDQNTGLKTRITIKPLTNTRKISSKLSFRPSRSVHAVKSILPIKAALTTTTKREEK